MRVAEQRLLPRVVWLWCHGVRTHPICQGILHKQLRRSRVLSGAVICARTSLRLASRWVTIRASHPSTRP